MSRFQQSSLVTSLFSVVLVAALLPAPRAAAQVKPAAWDQERVAAIAAQLADTAGDVYRAFTKKQTGNQVGSGQANASLRLKDNLRVARNEAKHLAKALSSGKSRAETEPAYNRLMTLVRDARASGRKLFLEKPILDEVGKANDLLDQLAPYYASGDAETPSAEAAPAT